jgi:hypothetical protein
MTRHLQRPYRIWPLDDDDKGEVNEATLKFSTMNLESSLSVSKCNNPLPAPVVVKNMAKSPSTKLQHEQTSHSDPKESTTIIASAAQQVLNTTELLEQILSYLDPFPLYRFRTVSAHWTSLIQTSPTLRSNLWLSTAAEALVPLCTTPHYPSAPSEMSYSGGFEINPILTALNIFRTSASEEHLYYAPSFLLSIRFPARWRTRDAFWRGMQITSPPVKRLFLRSSWLEKYVQCESGITAGMLADLLEFQTGALFLCHTHP